MTPAIFLSASVPSRPGYVSNPLAVRESVLALVEVAVQTTPIVFGGHPAITPLVEHAANSLDATGNVHIYQSKHFAAVIPPSAYKLTAFHWTPMGTTREASLTAMRREMIEEHGAKHSHIWKAAFFIGGMEGVEEEYAIFKHKYSVPAYPIASTDGAAYILWDRGEGPRDPAIRAYLRSSKRYRALFRELLPR